jgi:hypothetical protein
MRVVYKLLSKTTRKWRAAVFGIEELLTHIHSWKSKNVETQPKGSSIFVRCRIFENHWRAGNRVSQTLNPLMHCKRTVPIKTITWLVLPTVPNPARQQQPRLGKARRRMRMTPRSRSRFVSCWRIDAAAYTQPPTIAAKEAESKAPSTKTTREHTTDHPDPSPTPSLDSHIYKSQPFSMKEIGKKKMTSSSLL